MSFKPLLILFLSTGNAARSLVAETLVNARKSGSYRARSAGVAPLEAVPAETRELLEMAGFDVQKLHAKGWEEFRAAAEYVPVDIIVTLSEEARDLDLSGWPDPAPVRVHWTVDDPLGAERADVREWKFRKCLVTLEARINTLMRTRPTLSQAELFMVLKDIGMVV